MQKHLVSIWKGNPKTNGRRLGFIVCTYDYIMTHLISVPYEFIHHGAG